MKFVNLILFCFLLISCSADNKTVTGPGQQIPGTVVWMSIENGFWVIRGDDKQLYEPINLPKEFEKDGLLVLLNATIRDDLGSFRQVGRVIEIHKIKQR